MTGDAPDTDWLNGLFAAVDAKDTTRFVGFLTPDAEFRFGSAPAVSGTEAIAAAVDGFFATIAACRHRIDNTWSKDGTLACEGEVTYRRHDGTEITVPFADVFDMAGEKISRYQIYIDIAPLYAE